VKLWYIKSNYVFRWADYYRLATYISDTVPSNYTKPFYHASVKAKIAQYQDTQKLNSKKEKPSNCSTAGIGYFSKAHFKAAFNSP